MIIANELRKRNLLNWNLKLVHPESTLPEEMVEVFIILKDKIAYVYPNIENRAEPFEDDVAQMGKGTIPFSELEPVPLTEELLQKADCQMVNGAVTLGYGEGTSLQFQWDGKSLQQLSQTSAISSPITALHQLQNLYADVTGHQLEIAQQAE